MNLATRCLSCGTVFRVGESQLLASDGWVRCGRCNGVFNAAEVLFDIDTGAPIRLDLPLLGTPPDPPAAEDMPQPGAAPPPAQRIDPRFEPPRGGRAEPDGPLLRAPSREADDPDEPIVITDHVPPATAAGLSMEGTADPVETAAAAAGSPARPAGAAGAAAAAPPVMPVLPAMPAMPVPPVAQQASQAQAAPSFMRQAERAALWRQPLVRLGLWAGVVLLALGMLLQMALLWRDSLAAHLPGSAPALQGLCRLAGCSVQPLRRIQQLSVESSGLTRLEGSSLYRLQLVLRNRADTAVMVPALDLTLNDGQGRLVARRVLALAELGVAQPALQAGQELPIKVLMSTGERRIDGYTLELFYP